MIAASSLEHFASKSSSHSLVSHFCQVNNSLSAKKGTLRGMHYQLAPKAETKLVRCIRGPSMIWFLICVMIPPHLVAALVPS